MSPKTSLIPTISIALAIVAAGASASAAFFQTREAAQIQHQEIQREVADQAAAHASQVARADAADFRIRQLEDAILRQQAKIDLIYQAIVRIEERLQASVKR